MNNTVKVNLSIKLPGSVMLSQQAAENTPNSFNEFKIEINVMSEGAIESPNTLVAF